MGYYEVRHQCECGMTIKIPITLGMEVKAKEDYDLAQESAVEKFDNLWLWLHEASLYQLIRFWFRREG